MEWWRIGLLSLGFIGILVQLPDFLWESDVEECYRHCVKKGAKLYDKPNDSFIKMCKESCDSYDGYCPYLYKDIDRAPRTWECAERAVRCAAGVQLGGKPGDNCLVLPLPDGLKDK
jgi:hypothetical protein